MTLERYREIIPKWDRFVETIQTREPTTFRVRPDRIPRAELEANLSRQGFVTEAVQGLPGFLRVVDGPYSVALTPEHWHGDIYVQQTVTGVAAPVLAPRPGERVLDMCASPGGKTTHLADLLGGGGCLVAADVNEGRLKGLQGNLTRLLISNVISVTADGRRFPGGALFDRILVDAPCSAEGNLRKKQGRMRELNRSFRRHVTKLQELILRRAVDLVRPGGTILYVTCTFAPEENESVLSRVLADSPVKVLPVDLPVPSCPGVTSFAGLEYDPSVALAHRIYPHHMNSGGLFLALLRKDGGDQDSGPLPGWTPVPVAYPGDPASDEEAAAWIEAGLSRLREQYGVAPEHLTDLQWMVRRDNGWMHTCDAWPVPSWEGDGFRVSSVGLRGFSPDARDVPRPTNYLLRRLGPAVTQCRVDVDAATAARILRREDVPAPNMPPGHAALCVDGSVVGRVSVGRAGVRHEVPKSRAHDLLKVVTASEALP